MSLIKLPEHIYLGHLPTPIIKLNSYSSYAGKYDLFVKRDDLTGMELSGNKVRKLEFLLQEALHERAKRVVTCGGVQSNHCRATMFTAIKCGLKCTLFLRGEKPQQPTGNFLLEVLAGAEIRFVSPDEYKQIDRLMAEYAAGCAEKTYVIPEGGSNATGAWGYVKCFAEILEQSISASVSVVDTIVVATGSGGTHAGLLLGKLISGSDINVVSVNVSDNAGFFIRKISVIMDNFCKQFEMNLSWRGEDIHIIDGYSGEGYGIISDVEIKLIRDLMRREAIIVEPVYTAKAFGGMLKSMEKGEIPGRNILFIHTGGIFGLFPYGNTFAKSI